MLCGMRDVLAAVIVTGTPGCRVITSGVNVNPDISIVTACPPVDSG